MSKKADELKLKIDELEAERKKYKKIHKKLKASIENIKIRFATEKLKKEIVLLLEEKINSKGD